MAVHFTGPILFAGKDGNRKWFENLPVDKTLTIFVILTTLQG